MSRAKYIHGTEPEEQSRLAKLGELTDAAFVEFVRIEPTDRVLDVGSGLGNVARRMAARAIRGEVIGVEQSEQQLRRAREQLRANLRFEQGDAHALPFENGSFDVAYCRYLLEHVTDPRQILREMLRVLKPSGKAYLQENNILIHATDPDCPAFEHLWRQFANLQRQMGGDGEIGKRLFGLMRQAGFADITLSIQPDVHPHGTSAFIPWIENLLQIVRSVQAEFVRRELATSAEIGEGLAEFAALLQNPNACVYFYWNRAIGIKA
jgi:SAM-dependent methyltransferase